MLTTIAIKFDKTEFHQLYFWGCILGMYESFITKIVWFGYLGSDGPVLPKIIGIAPFEFVTAVLFWQPLMAFLLPLFISSILITDEGPLQEHTFKNFISRLKVELTQSRRIIIIIISIGMIGANPGGPVMILLVMMSSLVLFNIGWKYLKRIIPLGEHEKTIIEIFYFSRKGMTILTIILIFFYIVFGFIIVPDDRRPSVLQITMILLIYFVFLQLIFRKNTQSSALLPKNPQHLEIEILNEENADQIDYTPRMFYYYFRTILIFSIIFAVLSPINIILFIFAIVSMFPLGIYMFYRFYNEFLHL